ncbi:MAG: hypothetical protein WC988_03360 [Patescibacteria group bacterium]
MDFGLLVLWSVFLSVWLNNISGDVAKDGFFGWFLILSFPVLNVLFLTALIRGFRGAFRWLSGTVTWVFDVKREPFSLSIWRPYWVLLLGICVYLTVWHRPWGLFASLLIVGVFTIVYLLLHVGGNYGSGIPAEKIMLAQGHHPIGFFVFGFEALPGIAKIVGVAPIIWVLLLPFAAYAHYGALGTGVVGDILRFIEEICLSLRYWAYGCVTLVYWLVFAAVAWRRYGNIITTDDEIIVTVPTLHPLPGTRTAGIDIADIATTSSSTFLGACPVFNPGLMFEEGGGTDPYVARWVKQREFVDVVMERKQILAAQAQAQNPS